MTDALIIEPVSSLWTPAGLPTGQTRHGDLSIDLVRWPALPVVGPGELYFTELAATELGLASLEYRALTTANVVIYDRVLAPTVAKFLPLGGYAEPATPRRGAPDAIWERCLRFVRDGWSVVRLVTPSGARISEIRHLSEGLRRGKVPADLPVSVFANLGGGVYERSEAQLAELGDIIDLHYSEQPQLLTVVCDAIGGEVAPRLSVASTNGLAG
jgi:hypothetical protein